MSAIPTPLPTGLCPAPERFGRIVDALCDLVRKGSFPGVPAMLLVLLLGRFQRIGGRFASLVARARAGTLTPPRRRIAADHASKPSPSPGPSPGPAPGPLPWPPREPDRLPREHGWVVRRLGDAAAVLGRHVEELLKDAEMAVLVASDPRFGRVLRPLLHMLAVKDIPAALLLPPRERRARRQSRDALTARSEAPRRPQAFPLGRDAPPASVPRPPAPVATSPPAATAPAVTRPDVAPPGVAPRAVLPSALAPASKPGAVRRGWTYIQLYRG